MLKVVQLVLKPKLFWGWICLKAGLVSGPDMSKLFVAGLVSGPDLSKNFGARLGLRWEVSWSLFFYAPTTYLP